MNNLTKISKIFLFLATVSGILWLGNYINHYAITYKMFEPGTLDFKTVYSQTDYKMIIDILNTSTGFKLILYPIFIVSLTAFLFTSKIKFKEHGWLMIALLLVFLTMPFEAYLMTIDFRYVFNVYYNNYDVNTVMAAIKERLLTFNTFPFVQFLCYIFALLMLVFQPFKIKTKKKNEN